MNQIRNVLAIGAHPDDIELGCGGSLAKLVNDGAHVRALVLTKGHAGNRFNADRVDETRRALALLGITDVHTADFPDTQMEKKLRKVITYIEKHTVELKPDRVYTMFENDRHQDHRTTFQATIVACRAARQVLCYETPSCWPGFEPQVFEDIDGFLDKKIHALALHKSQCDRPYTQPEAMRINALSRGQHIGIGPAEGFIGYKIVL